MHFLAGSRNIYQKRKTENLCQQTSTNRFLGRQNALLSIVMRRNNALAAVFPLHARNFSHNENGSCISRFSKPKTFQSLGTSREEINAKPSTVPYLAKVAIAMILAVEIVRLIIYFVKLEIKRTIKKSINRNIQVEEIQIVEITRIMT